MTGSLGRIVDTATPGGLLNILDSYRELESWKKSLDRPTDRQTDHATLSVTVGRI